MSDQVNPEFKDKPKGADIMFYSEDVKSKALEMIEKNGVTRTSKELHIAEQTLYRWRKDAREADSKAQSAEVEKIQPETNPQNSYFDPKTEIEELQKLNQSCQQTIQYLVEENTALRQQCEQYLAAISLIAKSPFV